MSTTPHSEVNTLLIGQALEWREARDERGVDHAATFPEVRRFVHAVFDRIVNSAS